MEKRERASERARESEREKRRKKRKEEKRIYLLCHSHRENEDEIVHLFH
jgi:hypothetical protein